MIDALLLGGFRLKSAISPYKLAYLSMVKNIWSSSRYIERGHNIFEPADGSDITSPKFLIFDLKPHNFDAYL